VGNSSTASVGVTIPVNFGSDPYIITESAVQSLTTDTATNLFPSGGDDKYTGYNLPFAFPFYGVNRATLTVSTNGALYFSAPPRRDNGDADDAGSSVEGLQGQTMIAGLWDDIDINTAVRADSGVFVTQSDANRLVIRWQGVTFASPRGQINFEIELRRDGTIITRYGTNTNIFPVVGISGGEPDAYVVTSHTSETLQTNLTNAPTVTFAPRTTSVTTVCAQNQPIAFGQTINGTLANGDCLNPVENDGSLVDEYTFNGTAGQQIAVSMSSTQFDTVLYLLRPDGTVLEANDDINPNTNPPNTNSRVPVTGFITLPTSGVYSILANSFAPESRGAYSVTLTAGATCSSTPIAFGQTRTGSLSSGDCTNPVDDDGTLVDFYTFTGTAGQQISITMSAASGSSVNPYLYLLLPNGDLLAEDNDGGGGTTARIPQSTGFGRLPMSGTYTIVANTVATNQTGNYNLTLTQGANCVSTPIGFNATTNASLANGDCRLLEDGSFLDAYTFSGTAGQQIVISMTSSTTGLVPVLFLLSPTGTVLAIDANANSSNSARIPAGSGSFSLPANGTYTILANSFAPGQTGNYSLRVVDPAACTYSLASTTAQVGASGGQFTVGVTTQTGCAFTATSNSSFITVGTPTVGGAGAGTVPYTVQTNTGAERTGTIMINGLSFTVNQAAASAIEFKDATYQVGEGDGRATFTVVRTGNTSTSAAVDYRTTDRDTFTVGCADNMNNQGAAFARCDFSTSIGAIQFAPGETSKTINVPIIDDGHAEGSETFQVQLSNPSDSILGSTVSATMTILDNDAAGAANPLENNSFFVRQQYLDFLFREPDANGFNAWLGMLERCDQNFSPDCDRVTVSSAFFRSQEFQLKGYFVYRFYKLSFNRLPTYAEIIPDMISVTGATSSEVFQRRAAFANNWVQRPAFANSYNGLDNITFVNTLMGRYNLQVINTPDPASPDSGTKVVLTRTDLINRLNAGTLTRAQVLRGIADSDEVDAAEFNNAFVALAYYGYYRRTPDTSGYNQQLNYLGSNPGDFRAIIRNFLDSVEYKSRFGATNFIISGRITDAANSGAPLSNVVVSLSGTTSSSATTNGNGDYSFTNLALGGNYTVTPGLVNYAFDPQSKTFNSLNGNQRGDFTASRQFLTISGQIVADSTGLSGVTVTLSGSQPVTTTTDASGNYSFTNLPVTGEYVVTATKLNYTFTPPSRTFTNLSGNQTANFAATLNMYTISGLITDASSTGMAGVTRYAERVWRGHNDHRTLTATIHFWG
jgi:hypothetical protein